MKGEVAQLDVKKVLELSIPSHDFAVSAKIFKKKNSMHVLHEVKTTLSISLLINIEWHYDNMHITDRHALWICISTFKV